MGNTKQTKARVVRDFAPVHLRKICPDVFLIRGGGGGGGGGAGLELGDVSGGGEGGRRKEGHSGLGTEQFSHYTALTKGCHTK